MGHCWRFDSSMRKPPGSTPGCSGRQCTGAADERRRAARTAKAALLIATSADYFDGGGGGGGIVPPPSSPKVLTAAQPAHPGRHACVSGETWPLASIPRRASSGYWP